MADKKKMSVADILAAARKQDSKGGAPASADAPLAGEEPPVGEESLAEQTPETPVEEPVARPAAAAKPAAKPGGPAGARPNVKDILAAARAGGKLAAAAPAKGPAPPAKNPAAAAAKPAAAERPVPPKPVPPKKAAPQAEKAEKAAPAAGGLRDTASILAAARKTVQPGPMSKEQAAKAAPAAKTGEVPGDKPAKPAKAAEKTKPTVPPPPAKPEYAKKKPAEADDDRRGFVGFMLGSFLGLGFTAISATGALWGLGTARFMFPNILTEPPSQFKVGFPSDFPPGAVENKFKAQYGVWIVNGDYNGLQQIYALRTVCTHLGCTPNWLEAEQKFKCPCHGSGFYKDGINFEGPAPRPLERYAIRRADDGQLEVDKSRLFQEEMGQWADTASFVPV